MALNFNSLKIRGPRVAVVDVEEQNTTGLEFPVNASRSYIYARVVTLGDNVIGDKIAPFYFNIGDVIIFQANPMMIANCRFDVDGQKFMVALQSEPIAKLRNGQAELNIDTVEMAGQWVLCKLKTHDMIGGIYIPDNAVTSPKPPSFLFSKAGSDTQMTDVKVGTELLVERTRATAMKIGKDRYAYVHRDYVYGSVDSPDVVA